MSGILAVVHLCNLHHLKLIFILKVNTFASSLTNAIIPIHVLYQAPPNSSLFTCSLSIAGDNGMVTFYWDDKSENTIDHYCLTTSPSTNCSSCNILPNVSYNCPNLQTGHQYSLSVKAVNCEDQQGRNSTFMINLTSENLIHN